MDDNDDSYEAKVRHAVAKFEAEGIKAAVGDVAVVNVLAPGHPGLLVFVGPLFDAGERRLALKILESYCGQEPGDELAQMRLDDLRDADATLNLAERDEDSSDLVEARRGTAPPPPTPASSSIASLFRARLALHGTTPLYDRKNLERVLEVLETRGLAPQKWGLDERERKPYERAAAIGRLAATPTAYEQTDLYLWRSAPFKYEAALSLGAAADLRIRFESTPPASEWPRVFELADALAACLHPDWGGTGITFDLRDDVKRAPMQGDEQDADLLDACAFLHRLDYRAAGPLGLAPRTYIGPFYAEQLGRDRIETLPLVVERLAWGGYRIDLVPDPSAPEIPALLDAWRRGMAHLRDANVLATPRFDLGHVAGWKRGANVRRRSDVDRS